MAEMNHSTPTVNSKKRKIRFKSPNRHDKKIRTNRLLDSDSENDTATEGDELSSAEQEIDWSKVEEDLDRTAMKANLSARNVKSILHHILSDRNVIDYATNLAEKKQAPEELIKGAKLTRSKAKQLGHHAPILGPPEEKKISILDVEFSESSDEEYCPSEHSQASDEDMSALSDFIENQCSPFDDPKSNTSVLSQKNKQIDESPTCSLFQDSSKQVPTQSVTESVVTEVIADNEPEIIALRTRSRLPMPDIEIEEIEAMFEPPDADHLAHTNVLNDDDPDDVIWKQWLADFTKPLKSLNDTADDASDEDFNYMEAAEETDLELDHEELRNDKATRVSQKELQEMFNELLLGYENISDFNYQQNSPTRDEVSSWEVQEQNVQESNNDIDRDVSSMQISECDRQRIRAQMQQHVQLLTQKYLLTCPYQDYKDVSSTSKQYIEELAMFNDKSKEMKKQQQSGSSSIFCTPGIENAIRIVKSLSGMSIMTKIPRNKKVTEYPISNNIVELIATDPYFNMYKELIPLCGVSIPNKSQKSKQMQAVKSSKFLDVEDNLIVLGLRQFNDKDRYEKISEHLLPTKTPCQLKNRVKNICSSQMNNNPVYQYVKSEMEASFPIQFCVDIPRELPSKTIVEETRTAWKHITMPSWLVPIRKRMSILRCDAGRVDPTEMTNHEAVCEKIMKKPVKEQVAAQQPDDSLIMMKRNNNFLKQLSQKPATPAIPMPIINISYQPIISIVQPGTSYDGTNTSLQTITLPPIQQPLSAPLPVSIQQMNLQELSKIGVTTLPKKKRKQRKRKADVIKSLDFNNAPKNHSTISNRATDIELLSSPAHTLDSYSHFSSPIIESATSVLNPILQNTTSVSVSNPNVAICSSVSIPVVESVTCSSGFNPIVKDVLYSSVPSCMVENAASIVVPSCMVENATNRVVSSCTVENATNRVVSSCTVENATNSAVSSCTVENATNRVVSSCTDENTSCTIKSENLISSKNVLERYNITEKISRSTRHQNIKDIPCGLLHNLPNLDPIDDLTMGSPTKPLHNLSFNDVRDMLKTPQKEKHCQKHEQSKKTFSSATPKPDDILVTPNATPLKEATPQKFDSLENSPYDDGLYNEHDISNKHPVRTDLNAQWCDMKVHQNMNHKDIQDYFTSSDYVLTDENTNDFERVKELIPSTTSLLPIKSSMRSNAIVSTILTPNTNVCNRSFNNPGFVNNSVSPSHNTSSVSYEVSSLFTTPATNVSSCKSVTSVRSEVEREIPYPSECSSSHNTNQSFHPMPLLAINDIPTIDDDATRVSNVTTFVSNNTTCIAATCAPCITNKSPSTANSDKKVANIISESLPCIINGAITDTNLLVHSTTTCVADIMPFVTNNIQYAPIPAFSVSTAPCSSKSSFYVTSGVPNYSNIVNNNKIRPSFTTNITAFGNNNQCYVTMNASSLTNNIPTVNSSNQATVNTTFSASNNICSVNIIDQSSQNSKSLKALPSSFNNTLNQQTLNNEISFVNTSTLFSQMNANPNCRSPLEKVIFESGLTEVNDVGVILNQNIQTEGNKSTYNAVNILSNTNISSPNLQLIEDFINSSKTIKYETVNKKEQLVKENTTIIDPSNEESKSNVCSQTIDTDPAISSLIINSTDNRPNYETESKSDIFEHSGKSLSSPINSKAELKTKPLSSSLQHNLTNVIPPNNNKCKIKTKKKKKKKFNLEIKQQEKARQFAEYFLSRAKSVLAEHPILFEMLSLTLETVSTRLEAFYKVNEFLKDFPELVNIFVGFLEQHEARHVGKYLDWLSIDLVTSFQIAAEEYLYDKPGAYSKLMEKIIDITSKTKSSEIVVETIKPMLKGNQDLLHKFIRIFPDLPPPPCYDDDFEVIDFAAVAAGTKELDDFEEIPYLPSLETDITSSCSNYGRKQKRKVSFQQDCNIPYHSKQKSSTNIMAKKLKLLASKRKKVFPKSTTPSHDFSSDNTEEITNEDSKSQLIELKETGQEGEFISSTTIESTVKNNPAITHQINDNCFPQNGEVTDPLTENLNEEIEKNNMMLSKACEKITETHVTACNNTPITSFSLGNITKSASAPNNIFSNYKTTCDDVTSQRNDLAKSDVITQADVITQNDIIQNHVGAQSIVTKQDDGIAKNTLQDLLSIQNDAIDSQNDVITPQDDAIVQNDIITPPNDAIIAQNDIITPQNDGIVQNDIITPQNDAILQNDIITPQNDGIVVQNDIVTPQNDAIDSQNDAVMSNDELTTGETDIDFKVTNTLKSGGPILIDSSSDSSNINNTTKNNIGSVPLIPPLIEIFDSDNEASLKTFNREKIKTVQISTPKVDRLDYSNVENNIPVIQVTSPLPNIDLDLKSNFSFGNLSQIIPKCDLSNQENKKLQTINNIKSSDHKDNNKDNNEQSFKGKIKRRLSKCDLITLETGVSLDKFNDSDSLDIFLHPNVNALVQQRLDSCRQQVDQDEETKLSKHQTPSIAKQTVHYMKTDNKVKNSLLATLSENSELTFPEHPVLITPNKKLTKVSCELISAEKSQENSELTFPDHPVSLSVSINHSNVAKELPPILKSQENSELSFPESAVLVTPCKTLSKITDELSSSKKSQNFNLTFPENPVSFTPIKEHSIVTTELPSKEKNEVREKVGQEIKDANFTYLKGVEKSCQLVRTNQHVNQAPTLFPHGDHESTKVSNVSRQDDASMEDSATDNTLTTNNEYSTCDADTITKDWNESEIRIVLKHLQDHEDCSFALKDQMDSSLVCTQLQEELQMKRTSQQIREKIDEILLNFHTEESSENDDDL